ncbi:MAG: hypothetical protein JXB47_20110 [Anaerolineae bacterium]|nr:hypothetical protein [Anaerolineae bacterium]
MGMKEQVIQLEKHDDVVSVRDRLNLLPAGRVLLVFPRKGQILQRRLDLVLVQREAVRMNTRIGLVTDDFTVIQHADELNIPVFYTVRESRRSRRWASQKPVEVFGGRSDRPAHMPSAAKVIAGSQKEPLLIPPEFVAVRRVLSWLIFGVVVTVLLFGLYVILPGARVRLKPASDQVTVTAPIIADPELAALNLNDRAIPARVIGVEVEWSTTIPTTGQVETPNAKATGEVVFSNLLAEAVTVPVGTVVRTSAAEPIRFATTEEVVVPAGIASTVAAPVEALDEFTGPVGNVGEGLINRVEGPLSVQLAVTNPARTRGGGVALAAAVAKDDYERLRSTLLQQLQQRAYAEMLASEYLVGPADFVSVESLAIVLVLDETYSEYIGEPAETLSLDMRVVVQGVVINEPQARQVAYAALADRVGPNSRILDDTLTFMRGDELGVDDDRRVTFLMTATGEVATEIGPERVRSLVTGQPADRAAAALGAAYPLAGEPALELWPDWFGRLPLLPFRIEVQVDYSP